MFNIKKKIAEIIRVDHAGEYGAVRIYHGQIKAFAKQNNFEIIPEIEHMKQQEIQHLNYFNKELVERNVLSTAFLPFWHVAGYGLGYLSAKLGSDFAMTCTQSVEEVIDKHYQEQLIDLEFIKNQEDLAHNIEKFRLEELEHRDHAIEHNSDYYQSPTRKKLNKIFGHSVKLGCRIAIYLSKKI